MLQIVGVLGKKQIFATVSALLEDKQKSLELNAGLFIRFYKKGSAMNIMYAINSKDSLNEVMSGLETAQVCSIDDKFVYLIRENFKEEEKNLFAENILKMNMDDFFLGVSGGMGYFFGSTFT